MTAPSFSVVQVGRGRTPVLVCDAVAEPAATLVGIAAAMAPFPPARGNAYPGVRRHITAADGAAADYARRLLGGLSGAVGQAFDVAGFDLLDASFSIVTTRPDALAPQQRMPHFDSTDPAYLAILHYIAGTEGGGTAFYRQRATGIEYVDDANLPHFVAAARTGPAAPAAYVGDGDTGYERIAAVDGIPGRVVVYPGALLHSGTIPPDMPFSADPRLGRLTANFFVRGRPRG